MSNGVECHGHERGLGHECTNDARPNTRLCTSAMRIAKQRGLTIPHYSIGEQLTFARGPKKARLWHELSDKEIEMG